MKLESPDILTGGHWENVRGIQRWVADEPAKVVVTMHNLIACPSCHARIDETCKTKSGRSTTPHACRIVPRCCPCGGALRQRQRLCSPCSHAAAQQSKNEYGRRRRAAA